MHTDYWSENLEGRDNLQDIGIDRILEYSGRV